MLLTVLWSLNIIVMSHHGCCFVLGGSWCHSCLIGRSFAQQFWKGYLFNRLSMLDISYSIYSDNDKHLQLYSS